MEIRGRKPNRTVAHICKRCYVSFEGPNGSTKFCKSCRPIHRKIRDKEYGKNHRARQNELMKIRRANPAYRKKQMAWNEKWAKANPEKRREIKRIAQNNRCKRIYGYLAHSEWDDIKQKYGNRCLACLRKEPEIRLSIDHIIPISKGGKNLKENIQPLCRSCNSKKQASIIDYRLSSN